MKIHDKIESVLKQIGKDQRAQVEKHKLSDAKAQKMYLAVQQAMTPSNKTGDAAKVSCPAVKPEKEKPLSITLETEVDDFLKQISCKIPRKTKKKRQPRFMAMVATNPPSEALGKQLTRVANTYKRLRTRLLKGVADKVVTPEQAQIQLSVAGNRLREELVRKGLIKGSGK